jgi:hypothetical protein
MANVSLVDLGRRMDPGGKLMFMSELLSQSNEMVDDWPMVEGNLPTGHLVALRTALPKGTYIRFYQGTPYTASRGAQVQFGLSLLRAYSQVDKRMAMIGGNEKGLREQEDLAHFEGFSQQQSGTAIYGNTWANPEQFTGFFPYYNTVASANAQSAQNVFDGGGIGSSNASILLAGWGERTAFCIYGKGSKGGLVFENKGDIVPGFDAAQNRFEAFTSLIEWELGLAIPDWRYNVRVANLDTTTAGLAGPTPPDIFAILSKVVMRLPTAGRRISGVTKTDAPNGYEPPVRLKFYWNRTVAEYAAIQAIRDKNVLIGSKEYAGAPILDFRSIQFGIVDQLLNTESRVV